MTANHSFSVENSPRLREVGFEKQVRKGMACWILALSCCVASADVPGVIDGFSYDYANEDQTAIMITAYPKDAVGPVVIPASIEGAPVTVIAQEAFTQCTFITSVTIPEGVLEIGSDAFSGCHGLASLTIPVSVTYIGSYAFFDCIALPKVILPSGIADLSGHAFDDCTSLNRVYFLGNAPSMGDTVFDTPIENPSLRICYFNGKTGFTTPIWTVNLTPYATINLGSETPINQWLFQLGLPPDTNLKDDANGDGVNLLMAYALNLDPNQNLSGNLPQPVFGSNQMSLSFYAGKFELSYLVKTSVNLKDWTTTGVTLSAPDVNLIRTATVTYSGPRRFMRLEVSQ